MEYYQLVEFGCPHLTIFDNGDMYNSRTNNYYHPKPDASIELNLIPDVISSRISVSKLYNYYFNSPWVNGIDYRWLGPCGLSNYFVTIDGRVWGCAQHIYIRPSTDKDGYFQSNLVCDDGNTRLCRYHRLVAMAYIPNPDNKPMVNHMDGNKQNNHASNLGWVTDYENKQHARQTGLSPAVVNETQVHEICRLLATGCYTQTTIGKKVGVDQYTVKNIRRGCGWRHISQHYNIPNSWKDKDFYNGKYIIGRDSE